MPLLSTDIAIVGAGPAGALTAFRLARAGARVTIFDPSHPREKPCGGGVTGRALALVDDVIETETLPRTVIRDARFLDAATARAATLRLDVSTPGMPPLVVVDRTTFDAALLAAAERAGATVLRVRVTDVAAEADGIRIETTAGAHRARFLIGADGANSLVRRRLAKPFARSDLSIATGYFAHGVTSEEIVIELVPDPPGYIWSFPRPTHLAIGICAQADAGATADVLRARTARWIDATGIAKGARLEAYSWPIPTLGVSSLERLELHGDRWCLVGDAAGLVDPITREGIYFALLSGIWAAEAALTGSSAGYAARVRRELVHELVRAARLKAGFFRPMFTGLMVDALQQSAAIRAVMIDLIAGRQHYRTLHWRLLATGEWRLAWRAALAPGRQRFP